MLALVLPPPLDPSIPSPSSLSSARTYLRFALQPDIVRIPSCNMAPITRSSAKAAKISKLSSIQGHGRTRSSLRIAARAGASTTSSQIVNSLQSSNFPSGHQEHAPSTPRRSSRLASMSISPTSSATYASGSSSSLVPRSVGSGLTLSSSTTPSSTSSNAKTGRARPATEEKSHHQRNNWHPIREIVGEGRRDGNVVYLVDWEGHDPKSGVMWPNSWVCFLPLNINHLAVRSRGLSFSANTWAFTSPFFLQLSPKDVSKAAIREWQGPSRDAWLGIGV